jgi:hypothetical protein
VHLSDVAHLVLALARYLALRIICSIEELIGRRHGAGSEHVLTAVRAIWLLVRKLGAIKDGSIFLRVFTQYRRLMMRGQSLA